MARPSVRPTAIALDAWPALLAVVLCLPLLTRSGHPLARDLVFVPHQPLTLASVGLGDGAPRAVPLDAVVALLTQVVDGGVLARLVLPLVLALAGWGLHRLVGGLGTGARLLAGGLAVWNPYVVERLALGQWALLAGYATLPWLLLAGRRFRDSGAWGDLGATAGWLGLASLTPTGGVLGSAAALVAGAGRSARTWRLVALCVLLQLPWLVPSLLGAATATSDPAGVDAFSAGDEGPGGVLTALLGLGGIWDAQSVPGTRETWWSTVTAVLVVAALAVAWARGGLVRLLGRPDAVRLTALGAGGLLLAFASSVPGGTDLVAWLVDTVPGAGLLRDSQKFLAPFAVLAVVALAVVADAVLTAATRHGSEVVLAAGLLVVPLPVLLLPDGAATTWPTVDPVDFPAGLQRAADLVDSGPPGAQVATLPWRSYRGFTWGHGLTSSDPALRMVDRPVLVSDVLQVGPTTIRGESVRVRDLGAALLEEPAAQALAAHDVTWALVYRDDPAAADLDVTGLDEVYADRLVALYRVPGAAVPPAATGTPARVMTGLVDVLALGCVLTGAALGVRRAGRRRGKASGRGSR
ncbi:hypothetical protein H5V45_03020 [Nocardioides sp. KIGAM211]|uniref:Glycosyltransferase RgtA/B/C/D-like domain-containing protein n=1 Tax=Nocardioides luti TaxID=2761101 RepID=A0A7X0RDI0_9ACTN|nr:hypothetical protein [Nocardioides luti]MBB6626286.1 hypothetical protein [Nocardioides luti]